MIKYWLSILSLLLPIIIQAQKKILIAEECCCVKNYHTIAEATSTAIEKAKISLIKNTDINPQIYNPFDSLPIKSEFSNIISKYKIKEIDKLISDQKIELNTTTRNNEEYLCAEIKGKLQNHKNIKWSPKLSISGLYNKYLNKDLLTFTSILEHSGYITAFLFDDNQGWKIQPITDTDNILLKEKEIHRFPLNPKIELFLEKIEHKNKQEHNTLIIIYTSQKYIFDEPINFENVIKWIYTIPFNERDIIIRNITIL